jgi:hypothetical protein
MMQKPKQALEKHLEVLHLERKIGRRLGEGLALLNIGLDYADDRDFDIGIEYVNQAAEIFRSIGAGPRLGQALENIRLLEQKRQTLQGGESATSV